MKHYKVVNIADIDYLEMVVRYLRQSPKNASVYADILTDLVSRLRAKIDIPESDD